jgi:hypothetical protein
MGSRKNEDYRCVCTGHCGEIQVPTEDERVALNAMRSIREKARELKEKMACCASKEAGGEGSEILGMRARLDELRREWRAWESKKDMAARERMILLGHEEVDRG